MSREIQPLWLANTKKSKIICCVPEIHKKIGLGVIRNDTQLLLEKQSLHQVDLFFLFNLCLTFLYRLVEYNLL